MNFPMNFNKDLTDLLLSTVIKYIPHAVPLISHPWVANSKELC